MKIETSLMKISRCLNNINFNINYRSIGTIVKGKRYTKRYTDKYVSELKEEFYRTKGTRRGCELRQELIYVMAMKKKLAEFSSQLSACTLTLAAKYIDEGHSVLRILYDLYWFGDDNAIYSIIELAQNGSVGIRCEALNQLGKINPTTAGIISTIINSLNSTSIKVRRAAAETASPLGSAAAPTVPALIKALESDDSSLRASAAKALGNMGSAAAPAVPALIKVLSIYPRNPYDSSAKLQAIIAVGNIGPAAADAIPALNSIKNNDDLWVKNSPEGDYSRLCASVALEQIQRKVDMSINTSSTSSTSPETTNNMHLDVDRTNTGNSSETKRAVHTFDL